MVQGPVPQQASPRAVAVVIASAGRPTLLADVLCDVYAQDLVGVTVVVSVPDEASLPSGGLPDGCILVHEKGAAAQRNAGLDAVPQATHVFCFDDDAVIRHDYLSRGVAFFDDHPDVVALTGRVLADGASGAEISRESAERLLLESAKHKPSGNWRIGRELYGCNMAFRPPAVGAQQFDARLPLYSWLEDHDFARRAMRHGLLAKVEDCVVVHRGVKSGGRVAHKRLGYAQVMNPAYLHHVGSFPFWLMVSETVPRVGKNILLSIIGRERASRRKRVCGNAMAFWDAARGHFTPERMVELSDA